MVLNDLLDLGLELRGDGSSRDLLEELALAVEVLAEVSFPGSDLLDGDGVKLLIGARQKNLITCTRKNSDRRTKPLTPA